MDFDDPKGTSIWSMDFDNQKVYGDTSIFDGLVVFAICRRRKKLWAVCLTEDRTVHVHRLEEAEACQESVERWQPLQPHFGPSSPLFCWQWSALTTVLVRRRAVTVSAVLTMVSGGKTAACRRSVISRGKLIKSGRTLVDILYFVSNSGGAHCTSDKYPMITRDLAIDHMGNNVPSDLSSVKSENKPTLNFFSCLQMK